MNFYLTVCLKAALNSVNLTCSRSLSKQAIVFTNAIFAPSEMLSLMAWAIKILRILTWPPVTNFDSFSILAIASWAVDALTLKGRGAPVISARSNGKRLFFRVLIFCKKTNIL